MINVSIPPRMWRTGRLIKRKVSASVWQPTVGTVTRRIKERMEPSFADLTANYDVIIMKHCFPASDVYADTGKADPASPRQSLENYKAVYRRLRDLFDKNPHNLFIIWTLPPRHRLLKLLEGRQEGNAARATAFSKWLQHDYTMENGPHPNIIIWDFRGLIMDPDTNYLKYEYESDHNSSDSHPCPSANDKAGPLFSRFIVDSIKSYFGAGEVKQEVKIIFLHHSTGENVYKYPSHGLPAWFTAYNASNHTRYRISHRWYPQAGNMPVHYYRKWLAGRQSINVERSV